MHAKTALQIVYIAKTRNCVSSVRQVIMAIIVKNVLIIVNIVMDKNVINVQLGFIQIKIRSALLVNFLAHFANNITVQLAIWVIFILSSHAQPVVKNAGYVSVLNFVYHAKLDTFYKEFNAKFVKLDV